MQTPDIGIQFDRIWYSPAASEELAERLLTDTGLRVESDLFDNYLLDPAAPEVIVSILYTLFPLRDVYANILSSVLWEAATRKGERFGQQRTWAIFLVRKVDGHGRTLKAVSGVTTDRETIESLISQVDEKE